MVNKDLPENRNILYIRAGYFQSTPISVIQTNKFAGESYPQGYLQSLQRRLETRRCPLNFRTLVAQTSDNSVIRILAEFSPRPCRNRMIVVRLCTKDIRSAVEADSKNADADTRGTKVFLVHTECVYAALNINAKLAHRSRIIYRPSIFGDIFENPQTSYSTLARLLQCCCSGTFFLMVSEENFHFLSTSSARKNAFLRHFFTAFCFPRSRKQGGKNSTSPRIGESRRVA